MANPWLSIPLEDYEGHMGNAAVQQTPALSALFRRALDRFRPESVAVLGVAGGNGLEHIDPTVTKRVVGVDINQRYLDQVEQRFGALIGLELYCRDLGEGGLDLPRVDLVHAAMIFEHAGIGRALDNALSLVAPSGSFSVVLQLPSASAPGVAQTGYSSIQNVKEHFALIDTTEFQEMLAQRRFRLADEERRPLPAGKAFWFGAFTNRQRGGVIEALTWTGIPVFRRSRIPTQTGDPARPYHGQQCVHGRVVGITSAFLIANSEIPSHH